MSARVAALVLAAGRATRFGAPPETSKVYATLGGRALVAHVVAAAREAGATPVIVIAGHAAQRASAALGDTPADAVIVNADYASGMASSLQIGVEALPKDVEGALILLADMPTVAPTTLRALIRRFVQDAPDAVVPQHGGRSGNPVLLGRSLFAEVMRLDGDAGARRLLRQSGRSVVACSVDDPGILADVDTPEALERLRRR